MSKTSELEPVLEFLQGLQKNNNKAWFESHRPAYDLARTRFDEFVDELILGLGTIEDLRGVTAKDSVMRIYRDIRFSKDKSPYRTGMAASLGTGGRRSRRLAYFLHIEPHDASFLAGGLHMPEPGQLAKFRAAVGHDGWRFKAIVEDAAFRRFFGSVEGEKLKTAPQGYSRDHPEIELLRMKEVVAMHRLSDKEVVAAGFKEHVLQAFTAMKPFLDYLNKVIA